MLAINKILVINLVRRVDRLQHMTAELAHWGKTFERMDAITLPDKKNFPNRYIRSNWISHEECLEVARQNTTGLTLVLEDDVRIKSFPEVEQCATDIQAIPEWDMLYFYGSGKRGAIDRLQGVYNSHCYVVNPMSAAKVLKHTREKRELIEAGQETQNDCLLIDLYWGNYLQRMLQIYGTEMLITQDKEKFGSDTGSGWKGQYSHD
jgi:hypothetical protein